jgi:hypothetical protein
MIYFLKQNRINFKTNISYSLLRVCVITIITNHPPLRVRGYNTNFSCSPSGAGGNLQNNEKLDNN